MNITEISAIHLDVLKEICNIGAGNAATSLSQILGQKVEMHVPEAALVGFDDLLKIFGDEEEVVLGVMILLEGDITGSMIFSALLLYTRFRNNKITPNKRAPNRLT